MQHTWWLQKHKRSHTSITSRNHGGSQSVRGVRESSGSQPATENTRFSYLLSPALRTVLMSSSMSPVEIRAAMKAALFLFFILLSSFRHDIHYSFHSSEGEHDSVTSTFPLFKCWVYSGWSLNLIFACTKSRHCCEMYREDILYSQKLILMLSSGSYINGNGSNEYYIFSLVNSLL